MNVEDSGLQFICWISGITVTWSAAGNGLCHGLINGRVTAQLFNGVNLLVVTWYIDIGYIAGLWGREKNPKNAPWNLKQCRNWLLC